MKRSVFQVLLCLLALSRAGLAQSVVSGTLRGLVSDKSGALVRNAKVVLVSEAAGQQLERFSNSQGAFQFPTLPVGTYVLEVSAEGFKRQVVSAVVIEIGQTTSMTVKLVPGADDESITVTGESPLLRSEDSSLSSVINRSLLEDVPLSGRRFLDLALLVPNASPDGEQGLVSFAGEQGGQDTGYANANGANSFTLDGASATSNYFGAARGGERVPYIFGENAIQEFQIAQSPYSAEYGGAATGFVNVVTRSGSNDLHGDAFYFNRNSGTGANDAVNKANGIPRPVDILQQFCGALGAPIVRNHVWFFADYEQQRQKNPMSVVNPAFAGVTQEDFGVAADVPLPPPNAPLPVPGNSSTADSASPQYLQQVSNALHAIQSSLGTHPRFPNDWALFSKIDYRDSKDDRWYLSVNWNRFDSSGGAIIGNETPLFGSTTLANAFVRDYHAATGWSHTVGSNFLNEAHASFSRDDQFFTPTGLVNPNLPSIVLSGGGDADTGTALELGNAGFAGGRTNEAQWQGSDRVTYIRGQHTLKLGVEFSHTHLADLAFGGFDPDAARQNGTFRGTYTFSSLPNFALGEYDTFFQSSGHPNFTFNVPYLGFYFADTYQIRPRLTVDLGVREDFQIYPQPKINPAFPLTGQFPNQYQRLAPRLGFAWQPLEKTVVRGGFGMFYENLNGLNYRNSVVSNGLLTQQASATMGYDSSLAPNQQPTVFPNQISDPSLFSAPDISLVDSHFRFPYILQGSLQIEREVAPDTVITLGTTWTHGVHLIASSAYDMNLLPPVGQTTYVLCPQTASNALTDCNGRQMVLPTLDSGLLREGRINSNFGQINALITPGLNNYNSLFVEGQRRFRRGLGFQAAYTFSKNLMSRGVDFNNQFDFSNTHAPYLLDQRHRVSLAGVYHLGFGSKLHSSMLRAALSEWTLSSAMQFASGRPYAATLAAACPVNDLTVTTCPQDGNTLNNTAALQSTANSALGINGAGPSPFAGLNSFYGPWTEQVDLALSRGFRLSERQVLSFQVQAFNLLNHANYYVQNGNGVVAVQYSPFGEFCGNADTPHTNQTCYLLPNSGPSGFGTLLQINSLNGPRVLEFSMKWSF
jgi:hypothetical protein